MEPRYAYLGLLGAGLLLAFNINSHRPPPGTATTVEAATPAAVADVQQPAAAPIPTSSDQQAAQAEAEKQAAAKAAADKAVADQKAAAEAAAQKLEAEKATAAKQAADKAEAEKAAAAKAAAIEADLVKQKAAKQAAEQAAAQAKQEADKAAADTAFAAQQAAAKQAADKQAADKAAADKAASQKAEADKAAADKAAAAAPAASVATASASGPWDGGDATAGQVVFHKCQLCHYGEKGRTKIGPSLWGVVGRHSGSLEGYHYSTAMASYNHVWTPENLFVYLAAPMKVVHGTKMTFIGLPSETDRKNVIAYLETLK